MHMACLPCALRLRYSQKPMSIRQNLARFGHPQLPDFANLGVWLRVLLGVNLLALLTALAANQQWPALPAELMQLAARIEPPLIATLILLRLQQRALQHWSAPLAALWIVAVALGCASLQHLILSHLFPVAFDTSSLLRSLLWALLATLLMLYYFNQRAQQQAPAVAEARLMALSARIRPHFLFNSLNAVLGVMRSEPRRAETALEELADLFRVLMRENRQLVPLSEEIALARQYLSLERLRLGERLQVHWDIATVPPDTLMPPLMLQPLLENAVYHGLEPLDAPGEISISFKCRGNTLLIELTNPLPAASRQSAGNHMALNNIRERLQLFYDLEARLEAAADPLHGCYRVQIQLPARRGSSQQAVSEISP